MQQLRATEIWHNGVTAVEVQSRCNYRVTIDWHERELKIEAPGLSKELALEDLGLVGELEDSEALALAVVAALEGGMA
jgi:hypothetical protein